MSLKQKIFSLCEAKQLTFDVWWMGQESPLGDILIQAPPASKDGAM